MISQRQMMCEFYPQTQTSENTSRDYRKFGTIRDLLYYLPLLLPHKIYFTMVSCIKIYRQSRKTHLTCIVSSFSVVPQISTIGPSPGDSNSSKSGRSGGNGSSSVVTPVVIAVVVAMVAIILVLLLVYLRRKQLLIVRSGKG